MLLAEQAQPDVATAVDLLDGKKRALVLQGMERLAIPAENLLLALTDGGTPCSPEKFRRRFAQFVAGRLASCGGARVRISLDW
jgi:hypothetical protein